MAGSGFSPITQEAELQAHCDFLRLHLRGANHVESAASKSSGTPTIAALNQEIDLLKRALAKQDPTQHVLLESLFKSYGEYSYHNPDRDLLINTLTHRCQVLNYFTGTLTLHVSDGLTFIWSLPQDKQAGIFFTTLLRMHKIAYYQLAPNQIKILSIHITKLLRLIQLYSSNPERGREMLQRTTIGNAQAVSPVSLIQEELSPLIQHQQFHLIDEYFSKLNIDGSELGIFLLAVSQYWPMMSNLLDYIDSYIKPLLRAPGFNTTEESKEDDGPKTIDHVLQNALIVIRTTTDKHTLKSQDSIAQCHVLNTAILFLQNILALNSIIAKMVQRPLTGQKIEAPYFASLFFLLLESNHFLELSPLYEFSRLKRMFFTIMNKFFIDHASATDSVLIDISLEQINEIQYCFDEKECQKKINQLIEITKKMFGSIGTMTTILIGYTKRVCNQHLAHIKTLSTLTSTQRLEHALASFKENIHLLEDPSNPITPAFSSFYDTLAADTETSEETKIVLARHFGRMVGKFIAGKMKKLEDIAQCDEELQIALMGKSPPSPALQAAIGVLIGVIAAVVIALSGGTAAAAYGIGTSGSLIFGSAGFFNGQKRLANYEQAVEHKTQFIETAINKLMY